MSRLDTRHCHTTRGVDSLDGAVLSPRPAHLDDPDFVRQIEVRPLIDTAWRGLGDGAAPRRPRPSPRPSPPPPGGEGERSTEPREAREEQMLTMAQMAAKLDLTPSRIGQLVKEGWPHAKTAEGVRFTPTHLEMWQKRRAALGAAPRRGRPKKSAAESRPALVPVTAARAAAPETRPAFAPVGAGVRSSIAAVIEDLKAERGRLDQAIEVLEKLHGV